MKILSVLFLFSLLSFSFVLANEKPSTDTDAPIHLRQVNDTVFNHYLNDPNFDYSSEMAKVPLSLWERILSWIAKMLYDLLGESLGMPEIRFAIIIIALTLLVVLLLKSDIGKLFVSNRTRGRIDHEAESEDIRKLNMDEIISKAIVDRNFRRALRYLYLKLLKDLDEKELISWKLNKTNRDYANELGNKYNKKTFKELTLYYEYVWYGYFEINSESFEIIHIQYINYLKSLN